MGNLLGKKENRRLKRKELKRLTKKTHFEFKEIIDLYEQFVSISSSREDDGVIDKEEFKMALGLNISNSLFVDRMFALFDEDSDGNIDFREFICGLSIFCEKGTIEEKIKFSFKIYDFDHDGFISRSELYDLLKASLLENTLEIPEEQLQCLIDATFNEADVDKDGKISFDEYRVLVTKNPSMLNNITISTNKNKMK